MAITSMGSYSGANNNNNGMETSSSDLVAMLHGPCSNVGQLQVVAAPALLEDAVVITGQKRPYSSYDGPTVEDGDGDGDEAELSPVEKKRRLTFEQVRSLERNFEMENKLEPERKMQLAKELGLRPRQVAVWFQNRRARWKTKQLERDYETLAADYERLKADYEQVLGEKKQLKAEVQRLSSGNADDVKLLEPACRSRESEFLSRQHNARSSPTVDVSLAHHRFKDDVTASGSSSDVLDADSPRTTDSSSCGRHRESEHLIDASHSPESLNSFLGEDPAILQPLTMSKLEDHGPASDGDHGFHDEFVDQSCNYLLLQLDEQSVLPWWDWP